MRTYSAWHTIRLSFTLAWANFRLRNEGSYLGVLWYLLLPLAMFGILIFIKEANKGITVPQYPVYLIVGIVMYNLFSQITRAAITAITRNKRFVQSTQAPQEAFVFSGVFSVAISHIFEVIILGAFLWYFHLPLIGLLAYLLVACLFLFFVTGCALLLATLGVFVTDLGNVWQVAMTLLFFATPIFYAAPEPLPVMVLLNPIFYFIDAARSVLIAQVIPSGHELGILLGLSIFMFALGFMVFERYKRRFAELL